MTGEELVRFRRGDEALFRELHQRCMPALARHVRRLTRDPDETEELAQITWCRVFEARHKYQGIGTFEAWLFRIARRVCLMHLRALAVERRCMALQLAAAHAAPSAMSEDEVCAQERLMRVVPAVQQIMQALPPRQREVATRRWCGHQQIKTIAAELRVSPGTVKATLFHVRRRLQQELTATGMVD